MSITDFINYHVCFGMHRSELHVNDDHNFKALSDLRHFEMMHRLFNSKKLKRGGQTFNMGRYNDFMSLYNEIYVLRVYDRPRLNVERPIILDCGANIGMAMLRYKKLYPGARITCFEPAPASLNLLYTNIRDNFDFEEYDNVQVVDRAVTGKDGDQATFYVDLSSPGDINASLSPKKSFDPIKVQTCALSNYVNAYGHVDLLKLDIEGCEYAALKELQDTGCLSKIGAVVVEYHGYEQFYKCFRLLYENRFNPSCSGIYWFDHDVGMIYAVQERGA